MEKQILIILILIALYIIFNVVALVINSYASKRSQCNEWNLQKRIFFLCISAFFVWLGISALIIGLTLIKYMG